MQITRAKTKHPEAVDVTIAVRRVISEEVECLLKTLPVALRPRVQRELRKIRKLRTEQKTENRDVEFGFAES